MRKYADTILKGFATTAGLAVVMTAALSIFIWRSLVYGWFAVGAAMVMTAVVLYRYSKYPPTVAYHSGAASQKAVGCLRPHPWWLLRSLILAVLLQVVGNIAIWTYFPLTKNNIALPLADVTLPLVEKLPGVHPSSSPPQECKLRHISNYTGMPWRIFPHKNDWPQCLRFHCMDDTSKCDNALATNFDGPDPPCCVHILRDKARQFDRVMCYLGLEYLPYAGTLLGLTRSNRLIPWTADNDFLVSKKTVMEMISLWHTASHLEHGVLLVINKLNRRLCISPSFANGKLLRWKMNLTSEEALEDKMTDCYTDLYLIDEGFSRDCGRPSSSLLRPYARRSFYNGTLQLSFPNEPENLLAQLYGPNWRVPDPDKNKHGSGLCKQFSRERNAAAKVSQRERMERMLKVRERMAKVDR
jgi:hypothetical protein